MKALVVVFALWSGGAVPQETTQGTVGVHCEGGLVVLTFPVAVVSVAVELKRLVRVCGGSET